MWFFSVPPTQLTGMQTINTKRITMKKLLLAIALCSPSIAMASHNCTGTVNNIDIASSGTVHANIAGIGDGNVLCSVSKQLGLYTPEACKAALSMALAAKMADKKIRLYFQNDANTTCAKGNWKDFSSAGYQLYHVRLED